MYVEVVACLIRAVAEPNQVSKQYRCDLVI